ncbi:MAG TPA: SUMF1/EgtB/PvdO family nonheme iron enzyme [Rhodothermales bacterium]|nr:SUMF1/EgtB/PvdO family nonheme iron enzyme [Rhodothermales bacterium]
MMKAIFFWFCVLAGAPLWTQAQSRGVPVEVKTPEGQRVAYYKDSYALVIGMQQYQNSAWDDLADVPNDVHEVAHILRLRGFRVDSLLNADFKALRDRVADFLNTYGAEPDNRLLIYFSGHGYTQTINNQPIGYVLPVDAPAVSDRNFNRFAYKIETFAFEASGVQAKHILFVFDACFSGSFGLRDGTEIDPVIRDYTGQPVRQYITSGTQSEKVPAISIFRRRFVDALQGAADRNNDGYVTASELGFYLKERVILESRDTQHPTFGKALDGAYNKGEYIFALPQRVIRPPSEVSGADLSGMREQARSESGWRSVLRNMTSAFATVQAHESRNKTRESIQEWQDFLQQFQDDNPLNQEDNRMRSHARERLVLLQQKAQEEALQEQWVGYQNKMNAQFAVAEEIDRSDAEPQTKQGAWALFLNTYTQENPFSVEDNRQRTRATERMAYWKNPPPTAPALPIAAGQSQFTNSIGMKFVKIAAGSFMMGSPESDKDAHSDEKPQHRVRITKDFYVGQYEVTQAEWEAVMGSNPSHFKGATRPVERVSWEEAQAFIQKLNEKEGTSSYRLLTEAEWEYAARAGSTTRYSWGNEIGVNKANCDGCGSRWDNKETAPVGSFAANAWGLYDMHGNVWEWVQDWYQSDYYGKSPSSDPSNLTQNSNTFRVLRGGSWFFIPRDLRAANRGIAHPTYRGYDIGFRLAKTL